VTKEKSFQAFEVLRVLFLHRTTGSSLLHTHFVQCIDKLSMSRSSDEQNPFFAEQQASMQDEEELECRVCRGPTEEG
jgi:hypothetical protein